MSPSPTDGPDRHDPPRGESENAPVRMYRLLGIGFEFACMVIALTLLGWYLDWRWHTSPWLLIGGVVGGFAAGLWMLIRAGRQSFKD